MNVTVTQIIFIALAALMLLSAGAVIVVRNQVVAAMSLVASFFFLSAIYALLSAHTLAVLQILVYAGAILMLFLFVIMLLSFEEAPALPLVSQVTPMRAISFVAALAVGLVLVAVSLRSGMETKITSVRSDGFRTLVTFEQTPFRASSYAPAYGALGAGRTADAEFRVLGVAMGRTTEYVVQVVRGALRADEPATLWPEYERVNESYGTVSELGKLMYTRYLLPFEATSLLLLVAIVGAVVVAKGKI